MRSIFILAAAAALALLSTCAVDKGGGGTVQPIEIVLSFTTKADFDPNLHYFFVFNFSNTPNTGEDYRPLPEISGPNRGKRWERYIAFNGENKTVDGVWTLSKSDIGAFNLTGRGPADIISAVLSGDALADVVTANSLDDSVSVLLQNSNATFADHVDYATGDAPTGLIAYDYSGDGKLDLVVANSGDTDTGRSLSLLLNQGEGVFGTKTDIALPSAPYGICAGDFNGDGADDLAVTLYLDTAEGNRVAVLLKTDDGFADPVYTEVGKTPTAIAVTDLNGDANDDIAVLNSFDGDGGNSLMLLTSDGDGTFTVAQEFATDRQPVGLAVGRINADARDDYAVACAYNGDLGNTIHVFRSDGDAGWATPEILAVGHAPADVLIGDINADTRNDLVIVESADDADGNQVRTLTQTDTGGFGNTKTIKVGKTPRSAVLLEFSGDVNLDCAVANSADVAQGNSVSLLEGTATGEFTGVVDYWTDDLPKPLKNETWYRSVSITRNTFTVKLDPATFKNLAGEVPTSFLVDFMTSDTGIDYASNPDDYGIVYDWLLHPVVVKEEVGFETDEARLQLEQAPENTTNPPPDAGDITDWRVEVN